MSSRKRKDDDKKKDEAKPKHPGGPLQRSGASADSWNESLGSSLETISQLMLPTNRTILRRYRFLRVIDPSAASLNLAQIIGDEVIYIWNCARIPISATKYVHQQVNKLIEWWNQSGKKTATRMTPSFQEKLDQLFDIAQKPNGRYNEEKAHKFLNDQMSLKGKQKPKGFEKSVGEQDWTHDMNFYLDQKGPRLQQMGGKDKILTEKEKKKDERERQQQSSSSSHLHASTTNVSDDDTENVADIDFDTQDVDYVPQTKRSSGDGYVHLKIPSDAMTQLSPLAYRLKLSTRQQTAFFAGVVQVGGANLNDVKVSVTDTHRQRRVGVHKKTLSIKEDFLGNLPPHMILHWDSKKITYSNKKKKDERLAILGSFPGLNDNDGMQRSDQFFGAPLIARGTGLICAQTLVDTLSEWNIPGSTVIGMCWDTTASNTGCNKGAATLLESR